MFQLLSFPSLVPLFGFQETAGKLTNWGQFLFLAFQESKVHAYTKVKKQVAQSKDCKTVIGRRVQCSAQVCPPCSALESGRRTWGGPNPIYTVGYTSSDGTQGDLRQQCKNKATFKNNKPGKPPRRISIPAERAATLAPYMTGKVTPICAAKETTKKIIQAAKTTKASAATVSDTRVGCSAAMEPKKPPRPASLSRPVILSQQQIATQKCCHLLQEN